MSRFAANLRRQPHAAASLLPPCRTFYGPPGRQNWHRSEQYLPQRTSEQAGEGATRRLLLRLFLGCAFRLGQCD